MVAVNVIWSPYGGNWVEASVPHAAYGCFLYGKKSCNRLWVMRYWLYSK